MTAPSPGGAGSAPRRCPRGELGGSRRQGPLYPGPLCGNADRRRHAPANPGGGSAGGSGASRQRATPFVRGVLVWPTAGGTATAATIPCTARCEDYPECTPCAIAVRSRRRGQVDLGGRLASRRIWATAARWFGGLFCLVEPTKELGIHDYRLEEVEKPNAIRLQPLRRV